MLKIRDTSSVPSRPWRYTCPEDNQSFSDVYFLKLLNKAKAYRRANNFPVGSAFNEEFEANLCANTPDLCFDFVPPSMIAKAGKLAVALSRWAKSGFKVRSEAECEAILQQCRQCNHYAGENGVLRVACRLCGCSRKKVAMRTEVCPAGKWA